MYMCFIYIYIYGLDFSYTSHTYTHTYTYIYIHIYGSNTNRTHRLHMRKAPMNFYEFEGEIAEFFMWHPFILGVQIPKHLTSHSSRFSCEIPKPITTRNKRNARLSHFSGFLSSWKLHETVHLWASHNRQLRPPARSKKHRRSSKWGTIVTIVTIEIVEIHELSWTRILGILITNKQLHYIYIASNSGCRKKVSPSHNGWHEMDPYHLVPLGKTQSVLPSG